MIIYAGDIRAALANVEAACDDLVADVVRLRELIDRAVPAPQEASRPRLVTALAAFFRTRH